MIFRMYHTIYAISVHYEHRGGQSKKNVHTLFPPKNREKIHILIKLIVDYLITPSQHVYWSGFDLQAERRSANTAKAPASAAAAAAAASTAAAAATHWALSASPPFFALSPPAEMDSIASPPTGASVDGTSPSIAGSLSPLVYAEDLSKGGGAVARWRGDDGVRVLSLACCCRRRGEDVSINIRWEVGGGCMTKGGSR